MISNTDDFIPVSKAFIPPESEFNALIKEVWANGILTNNGPLVRRFEENLKQHTGVKHVFFVTSGTMALQISLRAAVPHRGKIITSAYSAVPTLSSILWEGYEPGFADIDPLTLNVSIPEIRKVIETDIDGILVPHIYGNSCDIKSLVEVAAKNNIPLIFDAAHAFGSGYMGKDIMHYGTVSVTSFHAYKILNSGEGGAIFTNDDDLAEKIYQMRYFGYDKNIEVNEVGLNGKSGELNAALGICNLRHIDEIKTSRKVQSEFYDKLIREYKLPVTQPSILAECDFNSAYYPIIFKDASYLQSVARTFEESNIQVKRYFHPSLNRLNILPVYQPMSVAESIAERVICLPLYYGLSFEQQKKVVEAIYRAIGKGN